MEREIVRSKLSGIHPGGGNVLHPFYCGILYTVRGGVPTAFEPTFVRSKTNKNTLSFKCHERPSAVRNLSGYTEPSLDPAGRVYSAASSSISSDEVGVAALSRNLVPALGSVADPHIQIRGHSGIGQFHLLPSHLLTS